MEQNELMKYDDMGKELNVPMKTAHMQTKRALDKAKLLLESKGFKLSDFFEESKDE